MTRNLRELASYTEDELERAARWPAIERYFQLLKNTPPRPEDFAGQIRLRRHRLWLKCAVATALESESAHDVCEYWSDCAEALLHEAWVKSGLDKSGYAVLALGKLGSRELNLSSDVDLILVRADESAISLKEFREFQNSLTELSEFGFALRLDFTLRPGGRASAGIPSLSEFENHYGYQGEMWERLAYVRMRILEGEPSLRSAIDGFTKKFSYRRHIDYTLLDELKQLRGKIRSEKFETRPNTYHLKLGEGGIRELELFVHSLQVMHGGRNLALRTFSTTKALEQIKMLNLLPDAECDFLLEAYWYLRTLENKLHAFEDQQNYLIDLKDGHPAMPSDFTAKLQSTTARVSEITSSLFGSSSATDTSGPRSHAVDEQQAWLTQNGFSQSSVNDVWPALIEATAQSRKTERDEAARREFLAGFVAKLAEIGLDRDLGLSILLDFVRAARAKASFFTLLNHQTQVRDDLARLFSISPYLGSILASRPELIDEFIFRKQAEPSADLDLLLEELAERRLVTELIGAQNFLFERDLDKLSRNLSSSADSICHDLLKTLKKEYGPSDAGLIALGKWGGRELGLRSDLDFIFVSPDEPTANDQKIAKRFLARITEPHRGGSIYAVDMRLRPSGSSGPILVSSTQLKDYLETKAAAWERQAYLRATVRDLDLSFHPAHVAASRGLSNDDRGELKMIREKLFTIGNENELDLKLTSGGLADIEFTAQIALLARREFSLDPSTSGMVQYLEGIESSWKTAGPRIRETYRELREIEQLFQLTTSQSGSKMRAKSDEFARLALVMGLTPADLIERVRTLFRNANEALASVRDIE